jgi:hypothetical protein
MCHGRPRGAGALSLFLDCESRLFLLYLQQFYRSSPLLQAFPWTHEARAEAAARARKPLNPLDGTLLRLACDNLALHATRAAERGNLSDALVHEVHDQLFAIEVRSVCSLSHMTASASVDTPHLDFLSVCSTVTHRVYALAIPAVKPLTGTPLCSPSSSPPYAWR